MAPGPVVGRRMSLGLDPVQALLQEHAKRSKTLLEEQEQQNREGVLKKEEEYYETLMSLFFLLPDVSLNRARVGTNSSSWCGAPLIE